MQTDCRDEIGCSDNHIGENSFGHLCKLMRTNYDTSDRELLEIRAELVHCDNRPDKHAFFLQLANGIRHRSVRQLELDWAQRKAAKREIQQGRASGDGLGDVATAAAASSGTAQLSALQSLFPRLPQLPLLPQNQPKAQAKSRHKAATKTAVQTQTQALLHRQASAQAQPETQLLHLNQSQPQQSFRDLKHNVRQDERHQQHPQQRRPQQDLGHVTEANTMLAHRRENGAVPDPTSTNAKAASSDSSKKSSGELLSGACNGSKPFAKQGEAPRSPKAADHRSRDAAQQEEERQDVVLSEDVKQQIKFHHGALKAIFDQQLELKLAELGWTSLEAKLRKHSSDIKVKEEQVARNSKIADLLRQSHHLDESEQAFLDETLWRMELAETSLGTLRREQQEMQAEMAHANLHVMDCQDKLSQSICLSNLQY